MSTNVGPELAEELIVNLRDPTAISEHLKRLQGIAETDPPLAIGTAKELVESTAKTVLLQLGRPRKRQGRHAALVRQAQEALMLLPTSGIDGPDGTQALGRILGGLMNITNGLAELRNRGYGTGHGPSGARVGLRSRHARLAVNAAVRGAASSSTHWQTPKLRGLRAMAPRRTHSRVEITRKRTYPDKLSKL